MEAEFLELRKACRRVAQSHIEAVTPEDVARAAQSVTPEQLRAVVTVMAQQYKFGDVVAYASPAAMQRAFDMSGRERNQLARDAVQFHKYLQCSILEAIDEGTHKQCIAAVQHAYTADRPEGLPPHTSPPPYKHRLEFGV